MEQESVLEENIRKIYEFANEFFIRIIERLKKTGAPERKYVLPQIRFVEQSTERGEKIQGVE